MKIKSILMVAVVGCGCLAWGGGTLYPGAGIRANDLCESKVTRDASGTTVWVHPNRPWSGVNFCLSNEVDFTAWRELVVTVSNATARPMPLNVHVKTRGFPDASVTVAKTLEAQAVGEIVVSGVAQSHCIDVVLPGMRGYEKAKGGLDLKRIGVVDVFRSNEPEPGVFRVLSIAFRGQGGGGVAAPAVGPDSFPMVDRFGQFKYGEWPGKVHSEAELAAGRAREDASLAAVKASPIPDADRFGGWAKGPQLKATGFFRVEKLNGKWWYVDPDGHLFFSLGIDCVGPSQQTGISKRERFFEWLPAADDRCFASCFGLAGWPAPHGFYADTNNVPYRTFDFGIANQIRLAGDNWRQADRERAHRRFRAWGVNTIGNWSDWGICQLDRTPYTATVHTGGFKKKLPRSKGWWGPLPDVYDPAYPNHVRREVRRVAAWMKNDPWCLGVFVDNELSWNEEPETLKAAERYFSVVSKIMKEELPNHLYLGCRFMASGGAGMYRAAAKSCDVVSVNIYTRIPKVSYPADAVDRPVQIGEFHFGALDRGMFHTGLVATPNQAERAAAYRAYMNAVIDDPRMVGAHWFQYRDQPFTGRFDGECYQIGFLNVADAPYPEMVAAAQELARTMYARRRSWVKVNR